MVSIQEKAKKAFSAQNQQSSHYRAIIQTLSKTGKKSLFGLFFDTILN
jgi:hypothetical protein